MKYGIPPILLWRLLNGLPPFFKKIYSHIWSKCATSPKLHIFSEFWALWCNLCFIFLSICKCVLPIHNQTIIDYRLKCQFEQLIFFSNVQKFLIDWSLTRRNLGCEYLDFMEIYILAPKLFEKLKVEKWNQKFKVYLKTLAKRNSWIKIRDYQIVRKHVIYNLCLFEVLKFV